MNLLKKFVVLNFFHKTNTRRSITIFSSLRWKDGPLPVSGLQIRFLNFFENLSKKNDAGSIDKSELCMPTSIESATSSATDLQKSFLNNSNLLYDDLIESIEKQLLFSNNSPSKDYLEILDKKCCKLLGQSSQSQVFRLLRLLIKFIPNDVTSLRFYKNAVLTLRKMLEINRLDRSEILQLLYIVSWKRKLGVKDVKIVMNFLPPLRELSLIEKSLVAQSIYQCSIGLKYEDVKTLEETIEENATMLVEDAAILSTLCKAVRRAGPTSHLSLNKLSEAIVNNEKKFSLMCAAHIISLYVEARLERFDVLQKLFNDSMIFVSMDRLKKIKIRIKDIDRLLWASSMMNYKLRKFDINEISSFIDRRYDELTNELFYFANIILSLWILNLKLKNVAEYFFSNKIFIPIIEEPKLWKPKARLHLLLACIRIETPDVILPNELAQTYKVGFKVSRSVKKLYEIIERLKTILEINDVKIDCPISGLYIPGVSLKFDQSIIHVDLLDETTCFKGTITPRGLMNLKIRLLSKIGVHSILISDMELNEPELLLEILKNRIVESTQ